jgi:hypothetical protein
MVTIQVAVASCLHVAVASCLQQPGPQSNATRFAGSDRCLHTLSVLCNSSVNTPLLKLATFPVTSSYR